MTKNAKILWVDLEMTGLDADNDLILEVAAIATDWEFKELDTYEGVVKNDHINLHERLELNSVFWNANPDSKRGLIDQNASGKDLVMIEDELLAFIEEYFEADVSVLLAGNS